MYQGYVLKVFLFFHGIHGTGIFTYMKGWCLMVFMWIEYTLRPLRPMDPTSCLTACVKGRPEISLLTSWWKKTSQTPEMYKTLGNTSPEIKMSPEDPGSCLKESRLPNCEFWGALLGFWGSNGIDYQPQLASWSRIVSHQQGSTFVSFRGFRSRRSLRSFPIAERLSHPASWKQWSKGSHEPLKVSKQHKSPGNLTFLGGGFKHFLFLPLFGEDSHFD